MVDQEWLTLPEAAEKLGLSVITLRRRLKDGKIEARQVTTEHGVKWLVRADTLEPTVSKVVGQVYQGESNLDQAEQPASLALVEAVKLISKLQEENRTLAGQVGFYQGQLQQFELAMTRAEAKISVLEAPQEELIKPDQAEEKLDHLASPWWRRWWGWLNPRPGE